MEDNAVYAQTLAMSHKLDDTQQVTLKKMLDANFTGNEQFKKYVSSLGLATRDSLDFSEEQGAYRAFVLGSLLKANPKMKEALKNPDSTYRFMNELSLPSDKALFDVEANSLNRASTILQNYNTPDTISELQRKLGVDPDGIAGKQTQTALANYLNMFGDEGLKTTQSKQEQGRLAAVRDAHDKDGNQLKVATNLNMDFGKETAALSHLVEREGVVYKTYLDSRNKPTAGVGHLMSPEDLAKYPLGTPIPASQVKAWFVEDSKKAIAAADKQIKELGIQSKQFRDALVSVNFQLGSAWNQKFPTAWGHLKNRNYKGAIAEIRFVKEGSNEKSKWHSQTPKRVNDFVAAIKALSN